MKRISVVLFILVAFFLMTKAPVRAGTNDNWQVKLTFSFTAGGTVQDPLDLVIGVNPTATTTAPKPPLPPGYARTGDQDDATISAYVLNGTEQTFQNILQKSSLTAPIYTWAIDIDCEASADVSLSVNLSDKPSGLTLLLFDPVSGTRHLLTGTGTVAVNDLYTASGSTRTLYFVAASGTGGGYVAQTGANVSGAVTLAGHDPGTGDHSGVTVSINGSVCDTTDSAGTFSCARTLAQNDTLKFEKPRSLTKLETYTGDSVGVPSLPGGDANEDNCVNGADFVILRPLYNVATCATLPPGSQFCPDFDGDGDIDGLDFVILKNSYNTGGDVLQPGDAAGCQ